MKQKFFFEILRNIHMPLQYEEYMMYTKTWVEDMKMYNVSVRWESYFEVCFIA